MIDHVSREVADLERSARFYDAVFHALGARRLLAEPGAVAWGVDAPVFRIEARPRPSAEIGHVALRASGRAAVDAAWAAGRGAGGAPDVPPHARPAEGIRCYAARLRDPDGLKVELVSR